MRPRRLELTVEGHDFALLLQHLDHDRGVPQLAQVREGPRLVHHGPVQRAGGVRLPLTASARWSAWNVAALRACSYRAAGARR